MRVISHPMRLDSAGAVVAIDDDSTRAAAEVAGHVVSCLVGERSLASGYGIPDPSSGVSGEIVAAAITVCEPEVSATGVVITLADQANVRVQVDVEWSAT
jgi:hypothetical protein